MRVSCTPDNFPCINISFQDIKLISALLESGLDLGLAVTNKMWQSDGYVLGLLSPLEDWQLFFLLLEPNHCAMRNISYMEKSHEGLQLKS